MDIDEYLSEKRAIDSKRDLEEAKRRLEAEKRRLREEEARMKELERYSEPARRKSGQPMQPWMVWNFLLLFLIGITFVISISVALLHEHPISETEKPTESSLTETTGAAVAPTKSNTTVSSGTVSPTKTTPPQTQNVVDLEPTPDFEAFLLYNALDPDNPSAVKADPLPQGGIAINGTDTLYYNIVLRSKEKDFIRCDGDRITTLDGGKDTDEKYYSGLKLDPFEKEELPNSFKGVGDLKVEWNFKCRFEGRLKETEKEVKFSLTIEG